MSSSLHKTAVAILFAAVLISLVGGEFEQWCVRNGRCDCSMIQVDQPCYLPNTQKDHAPFAFNSYYQKFKHCGGSCNFHGTAMVTDLDPSHGSCRYDYFPRGTCAGKLMMTKQWKGQR